MTCWSGWRRCRLRAGMRLAVRGNAHGRRAAFLQVLCCGKAWIWRDASCAASTATCGRRKRFKRRQELRNARASQARRRLALRRLRRVWHLRRSGRAWRCVQSMWRRWRSVRGRTGRCRRGWLLSGIVIERNKGKQRQSVSLLLIRVLGALLARWRARLCSDWCFGVDATKVRRNWIVCVLREAWKL
jgi:hypothetical protein